MATDYDAPRRHSEDEETDSLEGIKAATETKQAAQSPNVDEDDATAAENFELPGADLSHEELAIEVKPKQAGEFTCTSCYLVYGRSALADPEAMICRDCA